MATVKKTSSRTRPWQVRWRDDTDAQRKKSFARRVDADRFRADVEHQLNSGTYVDAAAGRRTFREVAEEWRAAQPVRPNTKLRHIRDLANHAYPAFGHRPAAAVRTSELQAWVTGLAEKLSPDTARVVYGTVRAVFRSMIHDRIIGRDPCLGVKPPEVHRDEVWPLTAEQVELLADLIEPRYRGLVILCAGAGHRQGEVFGARVEDVDFLRRREITVAQQVQVLAKVGAQVVPVKSRSSRRTVPAADSVLVELSEHLRRFRHPTADLLFCTPAGKPLHRSMFNEGVWWPARAAASDVYRQRAGKERDPDRRAELGRRAEQLATCGTHDLRHYFASALIRYGLDVKTVAVRMGHSTPAVTLRVYAHLWPDAEDRTRAAVDFAFGRKINPDVPQMCPGDLGVGAAPQVRSQK